MRRRSKKMRKIKTFTAEYSPTEDRVRLNCTNLQGATFAFWITQRLLNNVVAASVLRIEESVNKTEAVKHSGAYSSSLNHLEQQVARQQKSTGPKVKPLKTLYNSGTWLCHSVNIVTVAKGFNLQFKPEEGLAEMYTMALNTQDFRNVLDVIFRTYAKAGWDNAAFPNWLINTSLAAETHSLLN